MPTSRFEPSSIKNKIKREEVSRKQKKAKLQRKLQRRLEQAKHESADPLAKKKRLASNVPRTLDNTREFDPSILTANLTAPPEVENGASSSASSSTTIPATTSDPNTQPAHEHLLDISSDPFASYFASASVDLSKPPKVLITTSPKATRLTYDFCDELVGVIPGADFVRRKGGKGFELGRIAGWAADRGYGNMVVVNENRKQPNAITFIHLPSGPTAFFKLTSIQLSKQIAGHARGTTHYPELVLNNFVTRLGHTVGRFFQTLFPPLPEFQGRQVVTLHNQRDFLFFRRHRYAFRSPEKAALQEIGPRFTLKLRWLKRGLPAVQVLGAPARPLEFAQDAEDEDEAEAAAEIGSRMQSREVVAQVGGADRIEATDGAEDEGASAENALDSISKTLPPTQDGYIWMWKPALETTRRTFFL